MAIAMTSVNKEVTASEYLQASGNKNSGSDDARLEPSLLNKQLCSSCLQLLLRMKRPHDGQYHSNLSPRYPHRVYIHACMKAACGL